MFRERIIRATNGIIGIVSWDCLFCTCCTNLPQGCQLIDKCSVFHNEARLGYEPCEKTGFLHMRKQRRRSAAQLISAFVFRYTDSTTPLLPKSEISSILPSCVVVQPGLCRTWSEIPEDRFSHNEAYIIINKKVRVAGYILTIR